MTHASMHRRTHSTTCFCCFLYQHAHRTHVHTVGSTAAFAAEIVSRPRQHCTAEFYNNSHSCCCVCLHLMIELIKHCSNHAQPGHATNYGTAVHPHPQHTHTYTHTRHRHPLGRLSSSSFEGFQQAPAEIDNSVKFHSPCDVCLHSVMHPYKGLCAPRSASCTVVRVVMAEECP